MKIHVDVLRRYTALPDSLRQVRLLLDDLGLEVKRLNVDGHLTLELLANRGDHHCYEGLAREITGRTGEALTTPPVATLTVGESPWPLRLGTDLCLVYTATLLERVGEAPGQLDEAQLAPFAPRASPRCSRLWTPRTSPTWSSASPPTSSTPTPSSAR
jgi:phenylalanyl-tRNA synthetase beta chain